MRVVHFLHGRANPNGTNGGDRVIYNLAKYTAELGAQVLCSAFRRNLLFPLGLCVQRLSFRRDPFSLPSRTYCDAPRYEPDIVHFHGVYSLGT